MLRHLRRRSRLCALFDAAGTRNSFSRRWEVAGCLAPHRGCRNPIGPRITKAFLAEELNPSASQRFSEEYGLEFLDPDEAVFPTRLLMGAAFSARCHAAVELATPLPRPRFLRVYASSTRWIVGVDLGHPLTRPKCRSRNIRGRARSYSPNRGAPPPARSRRSPARGGRTPP